MPKASSVPGEDPGVEHRIADIARQLIADRRNQRVGRDDGKKGEAEEGERGFHCGRWRGYQVGSVSRRYTGGYPRARGCSDRRFGVLRHGFVTSACHHSQEITKTHETYEGFESLRARREAVITWRRRHYNR